MSGEEKKELDFFSEEIESSIDSLFKPKKLIEIDPVTNQIKEIEASPSEVLKPKADELEIPQPSKTETLTFIEELKQALLAFEWEINDKNLSNLKKHIISLDKYIPLNHPVTKNIHSLILENITLMSQNLLKIPAKGPTSIQKGIDVIMLYHQKGDDAILQLGDNITQTLSLLEDVKASLQEQTIITPKPEISLEPIFEPKTEPIKEVSTTKIEPSSVTPELELELEPIIDTQENKATKLDTTPKLELQIDDLIDKTLVSNQPQPQPQDKIQQKTQEINLELSLEPEITQKSILDNQFTQIKPTPQVDKKTPEKATLETKPLELTKPNVIPQDTTPPATQFAPKFSITLNEQIQRFNEYIEKLANLESVCCNVQSLAKICQFARKMRNDLERDRKQLIDLLGKDYKPTQTVTSHKENLISTDLITPKTQEFSEILQVQWGNETIGILPEEVAFEGSLSFWYNLFYGNKITRLNEIPLKILRPFPWSSIKSSLRGQILNLDDNTLLSLNVPLKKSPSHPLGIPKNPIIIILYRDGKSIAILSPTKSQPKSVGDFTFVSQEDEYFVGFLQKNNEKIKLLSLKKP